MAQQERPSSKATEQIKFAGDFDTGLTAAEKLEAAVKFDDLVQSTLFQFAESTSNYSHDAMIPNGCSSKLSLSVPQEDGSFVSVSVESTSLDNGTKRREIFIQEIYENRGRGFHNYYIEDNQVLRYDNANPVISSNNSSTALSVEGIRQNIAAVRTERENSRLEQQMGLNRQPVGVDEINKLAELLESAKPRFR